MSCYVSTGSVFVLLLLLVHAWREWQRGVQQKEGDGDTAAQKTRLEIRLGEAEI